MGKLASNWHEEMAADAKPDVQNKNARQERAKHKNLVWVQCENSRCLAYTNATGKWISFYTGKRLADFIKVIG
jgi:hypothetical protein